MHVLEAGLEQAEMDTGSLLTRRLLLCWEV